MPNFDGNTGIDKAIMTLAIKDIWDNGTIEDPMTRSIIYVENEGESTKRQRLKLYCVKISHTNSAEYFMPDIFREFWSHSAFITFSL